MADQEIVYYACIPITRVTPSTVFRFFNDPSKSPQRYSQGHGWVEDQNLWLLKFKGEITEADRISEAQAATVLNQLAGS